MMNESDNLILAPVIQDDNEQLDYLIEFTNDSSQPLINKRQNVSKKRVVQFLNNQSSNLMNANDRQSNREIIYNPQIQIKQEPNLDQEQQFNYSQSNQYEPINYQSQSYNSNYMGQSHINSFDGQFRETNHEYPSTNNYYASQHSTNFNSNNNFIEQPFYFGQNAVIYPSSSTNPVFNFISSQSDLDCQLIEPPIQAGKQFIQQHQSIGHQSFDNHHFLVNSRDDSESIRTTNTDLSNGISSPIANVFVYDIESNFDETVIDSTNDKTELEQDPLEFMRDLSNELNDYYKNHKDEFDQPQTNAEFAELNKWKKKIISKLMHSSKEIVFQNDYSALSREQCEQLKNDQQLLSQFKRIQDKSRSVRSIMYKNQETNNIGLREMVDKARELSLEKRIQQHIRFGLEKLEDNLKTHFN